ncbi:MAG: hypothetical protein ACR2FM_03420, partial [Candidatus Saccharimonadales bacterium]
NRAGILFFKETIMTRNPYELLEQQTRYGQGYTELRRDNYTEFFADYAAGPADVAYNVLDRTLNKESLIALTQNGIAKKQAEGDPTSCFVMARSQVIPVIKSVAAIAINEYGFAEVGYIDINDAVQTQERGENTLRKIQLLDRLSRSLGKGTKLITVRAGVKLEDAKSQVAEDIYGSLSQLSPKIFRVAVLGQRSNESTF